MIQENDTRVAAKTSLSVPSSLFTVQQEDTSIEYEKGNVQWQC